MFCSFIVFNIYTFLIYIYTYYAYVCYSASNAAKRSKLYLLLQLDIIYCCMLEFPPFHRINISLPPIAHIHVKFEDILSRSSHSLVCQPTEPNSSGESVWPICVVTLPVHMLTILQLGIQVTLEVKNSCQCG